jgi:hypothetical protein
MGALKKPKPAEKSEKPTTLRVSKDTARRANMAMAVRGFKAMDDYIVWLLDQVEPREEYERFLQAMDAKRPKER